MSITIYDVGIRMREAECSNDGLVGSNGGMEDGHGGAVPLREMGRQEVTVCEGATDGAWEILRCAQGDKFR